MRSAGTFHTRGPTSAHATGAMAGKPFMVQLEGESPGTAELAPCSHPEFAAQVLATTLAASLTVLLGGDYDLCWRVRPDAAWVRVGSVTVRGPSSVTDGDGFPLRPNIGQRFDMHIKGAGLDAADFVGLGNSEDGEGACANPLSRRARS